jgi:hypothetical protein
MVRPVAQPTRLDALRRFYLHGRCGVEEFEAARDRLVRSGHASDELAGAGNPERLARGECVAATTRSQVHEALGLLGLER